MAEEKKEEVKHPHLLIEVIFILIAVYFLSLVWERLGDFFYYYFGGNPDSPLSTFFTGLFLNKVWPFIIFMAMVITVVAVVGIATAYKKLRAIEEEEEKLYSKEDVPLPIGAEYIEKRNESWEAVLKHINSPNSSDWRLAIIEADIMLDELLRAAGYHGDTTGEMLKAVEKSDFTTIDQAWEAHKIRNRIAHSGSRFPLNEREAKYAIALYEAVFKEFKII